MLGRRGSYGRGGGRLLGLLADTLGCLESGSSFLGAGVGLVVLLHLHLVRLGREGQQALKRVVGLGN